MAEQAGRLTLGVFFGGRSAEHEISIVSARSVVAAVDRERFDPVLVGIDRQGRWFLHDEATFGRMKEVDGSGLGGEVVLVRHGGEGLQALQHLVATAFRKQLGDDNRIVIDCNGFRRDKDAELKQMARFVADKAKSTGMPQEMGPLNPYERRIVHLTIADDPGVTSESIGDAFMKTVIISTKS